MMPKIIEKRSQNYAQNDVKSSMGGHLGANPFKLWDWKPRIETGTWKMDVGIQKKSTGMWKMLSRVQGP